MCGVSEADIGLVLTRIKTYKAQLNGNLTSDGTTTTTWDRANRMIAWGSHTYAYDGNGARIAQTVSGVVTTYLQDTQPGLAKLLSETAGAATTRYLHGPRGLHVQHDGTAWSYPVQDGLGSVVGMTDATGTILGAVERTPYGSTVSGSVPTHFGYTGEYIDPTNIQELDCRIRCYSSGLTEQYSESPHRHFVKCFR